MPSSQKTSHSSSIRRVLRAHPRVMLSHANLSWTANGAVAITNSTPDDYSLSYLPLCHIAEQMFTIHGPITGGYSVYYAESMEKLPDNLKEVQPTVFLSTACVREVL